MLAVWVEVLPLFLVRWLARKYCGTINIHGNLFHEARHGVLVSVKESI